MGTWTGDHPGRPGAASVKNKYLKKQHRASSLSCYDVAGCTAAKACVARGFSLRPRQAVVWGRRLGKDRRLHLPEWAEAACWDAGEEFREAKCCRKLLSNPPASASACLSLRGAVMGTREGVSAGPRTCPGELSFLFLITTARPEGDGFFLTFWPCQQEHHPS